MSEKIMMIPAREQPAFDATRWFTSGMYRRKESPLEGWKYNPYGMTRVSPPAFPSEQLPELRDWIAFGIKNDYGKMTLEVPDVADDLLRDERFDPRPQIVYVFSGFQETDKPRDNYIFYALIEGKRFFVLLERDGISGEIISARRESRMRGMRKEDMDALFQVLEKRQKPGLRVSSGQPCPYPGVWECLDCPLAPQTFAHGVTLPQVEGRVVTWRLVKAL
ncbi:hypothetical protein [Zestomonas carbonaria]|nr:hypothetical protein [Pseudomonas carbonaria]